MGTERASKKDPRILYERTINYKTGKYWTKTRPNPRYKGMTLEQAKAIEKVNPTPPASSDGCGCGCIIWFIIIVGFLLLFV